MPADLPRLDLPGVGATGAVPATLAVGDPRQQAFQRALQTMLGSELPVKVLARMTDGSALVEVAGMPARMQLPPEQAPGTTLPLTVVAAFPRPTFQLATANPGAPLVLTASADPKGAAALAAAQPALPALPAANLPKAAEGAPLPAASTILSPAARLLGAALAASPGVPTVHAAAPLAPDARISAERLAPALRQALATSGLFYESHLADWAGGSRSLDSLAAEPQLRQPPADQDATVRYLAPQLALQDQQQLVWQGQLAPGLPLEWRVGRDAPQQGQQQGQQGGAGDEESGWHSGLRLRFAHLGELEATVTLRGNALAIRVDAADDAAAALLRSHAPRLAGALAAAGLPLAAFAAGSGTDGQDG